VQETDRRARVGPRMRPRAPRRLASDDRLVALLRRGDPTAFEALYDRHAAALLSYCFFMLGSREDAEDAVQSTFASAYCALLRDEREVEVRPWLFAIARNACVGVLRKRRPQEAEPLAEGSGEDLFAKVERRESIRQLLATMLELPERHRTALVLAELHGQSQREIGRVLGVSPDTVKSYIFQARATLASERVARETACHEIRDELASARGATLLRGRLRRHLRSCEDCRAYADRVLRRRRELGAVLPLLPTLALKRRVLDATAGHAAGAGVCVGGTGAGITMAGALELGGAGAKTLLAKVLIGVSGLAAGAGAGTLAISAAASAPSVGRLHSTRAVELASSRVGGRAGRGTSAPLADGVATPSGTPSSGSADPATPVAGGELAGKTVRPEQADRPAGGPTQAKVALVEEQGGSHAAGQERSGNGKAIGHAEGHGNSEAAHAGTNGNGKSAEHSHGQGNGIGVGNGNSASHGNSTSHGNSRGHRGAEHTNAAANGKALGHGEAASGTQAVQGGSASHGGKSSVATATPGAASNGHASPGAPGQAETGEAGSGSSAQPNIEPNRLEEAPKGQVQKELSPAPGASEEHGSRVGAEHEPPGQQAKG